MKKNKLMRIASVLLVATLLSTSVISGTFAKYVTTDEAQDTARVAKFGVVATVMGDLYGQTYKAAADANAITSYGVNTPTVSVNAVANSNPAAGDGKVVAPGTQSLKDMLFSITGTPEVSTLVHFDPSEDASGTDLAPSTISLDATKKFGIMVAYTGPKTKELSGEYYSLKDGVYTRIDATTFDAAIAAKDWYELKDVTKTASAIYQPVRYSWDLIPSGAQSSTDTKGNIFQAYNAIAQIFDGKSFVPNENNAISANLRWAWTFGDPWKDDVTGENYSDKDRLDTILGDMMADQLEDVPYTVVVEISGTTVEYHAVAYTTASAVSGSANSVIIAYDSTINSATIPTAAFTSANADCGLNTNVLAVLTESFSARIIVEQLD